MSWTINEQAKTSETQYFTASYSTGIVVPDNQTMDSEKINVAGYTAGTISFSLTPGPSGLSTGADALLSSITQQTVGATGGPYGPVASTSSGSGSGATFNVTLGANPPGEVTSITAVVTGSGYAIGDTVTIANGLIGGGGTDLVITLQAADLWAVGSTLEMTILGTIDTNSFIAVTLVITAGDVNSTFYVDWNIPLEKVALRVHNVSTGQTITVSGIRLITESNGGGLGYVSTSGASVGPGGSDKTIQFNDGGVFGGASGALYDNTVNSPVGQVLLGGLAEDLGTIQALEMNPILSFQTDTNTGMFYSTIDPDGNPSAPSNISFSVNGNEALRIASTNQEDLPTLAINGCIDSGIFEPGSNNIGISAGGTLRCTATNATGTGTISVGGFTVGKVGDPMALVRFSNPIANSWEDGNCGNSEFLIFTASEFTNYNLTSETPESWAVIRVAAMSRSFTGTPCGVMESAAPAGGSEITAMKLLPKGFRVPDGNATGILYTNDVQFGEAGLTFIVYWVDSGHPAVFPAGEPTALCASTTITTGLGTNNDRTSFTTTAASDTGNGSIVIIVSVIVPTTTQFSRANGGLVGIRVPMERI